MSSNTWIPSLVEFQSANENCDQYLSRLYAIFTTDFINSTPIFNGEHLSHKRHPEINGRSAIFHHLLGEDEYHSQDEVIKRCVRIKWPKPIIENSTDSELKVWKNKRKGKSNICIFLEECEYLVVLSERKGYTLFWTAYPITRAHTKRKLLKEFEKFKKAEAATRK